MRSFFVLPLLVLAPMHAAADPIPFAPATNLGVVARPVAIAAGDVNRDGRIDFVVADGDADAVWLFSRRADGATQIDAALKTGLSPSAVQIADLNRDAWPDVIVANAIGNSVSVFLGRGDR